MKRTRFLTGAARIWLFTHALTSGDGGHTEHELPYDVNIRAGCSRRSGRVGRLCRRGLHRAGRVAGPWKA